MRSFRWLVALIALASCDALPAFADAVPKSDGAVSSAPPSRRTVAALPSCVTAIEGRRYTLTDAASATDQTVGGGSNVHVAVCQQGVWIAENPASGGGVADGDKSDITVSGGGVNWQIDADAVAAPELAADSVGASEIAAGAVGASEAAALDAGDVTTGTFGDALIPSGVTRDTESPAAGDITGSHSAGYQIGAGAVGAAEAAGLDAGDTTTGTFGAARIPALDTLSGAVTDAQVPNTITIDAATAALSLDQTAGETDLRYDATEECFYLDADGSGTRANSEAEQCIDGTVDGTFASDDRKLYCNPIAFERNGTTTTRGIQECIDAVGAYGGGTVLLGPRIYSLTGAVGIVVDEGDAGEVRIVGAGKGATVIRCNSGDGCTAATVVSLLDDRASVAHLTISTDVSGTNGLRVGDASNYAEEGVVDQVLVTNSGAGAGTPGSRTGTGIILSGLESHLIGVSVEKYATCIANTGTAQGRVNAVDLISPHISSCDAAGISLGVGGFSANTSDSQSFNVFGGTIQNIQLYGVHARGGSSDASQRNSVRLFGTYIEGVDSGVFVDGSAAAFDPNVHWYGGGCSLAVDSAADGDTDSDCIVADSDANSIVVFEAVYSNATQCIEHNGSGYVYIQGLPTDASPCNASSIVLGGTAILRDLDVDPVFRDEAATITGAWDFGNALDGEDIAATIAGAGLTETAGSPDTIDIALHATGPGLATSGDVLSLIRSCADGQLLEYTAAGGWACANDDGGVGGGAPTTVDYLVGTADGTLSNEIVVGTSPGGELGGTWAAPTLDDGLSVTGWNLGASFATSFEFEGVTADAFEHVLDSADPTADVTFRLPALGAGTFNVATREAAETFSGVKTFSVAPNLAASSVDAITEIAAAIREGSGTKLITGTEGSDLLTIETQSSSNTVRVLFSNPGSGAVSLESEQHPTDGGTLRALEGADDGANFFGFKVPNSGLTLDREITLEDDANPIPDSAVGDGVDDDVPEAADFGALTAGNGLTAPSTGTLDVTPGLGLRISSDTVGLDPTAALSGDHTLSAGEAKFGANGLIFEGSGADAFETYVAVTNPTADRTLTIPDAASVAIQPITCGGTDKVSAVSAAGVVTCSADQTSAGSNDSIRVEDGNDAGTYTDATDADFSDQGDINFALDTASSPDQITATVRADSVALGTDTTGNYAGSSSEGGAATSALAATALAANGANCSAGSVAGGVDASGAAESCIDPLTASDTETLTNKTLDAEGTGNVVTLPLPVPLAAAGCNNATAASFWDLPATNAAVAACRTGTNVQGGTLDFADGQNLSAQTWVRLPTGWTGAIDAVADWISSTTSGDVVWQIAIACAGDGDSDDPAFTDDLFTADTAKGTGNQLNATASNTVTTTGTCAAGDLARVRIKRDSADAGDTMAGTARLMGVHLTMRVAF